MTLATLLVIVAVVLFVCAAFGVPSRVGLGWMGLAVWALADLLGGVSLT